MSVTIRSQHSVPFSRPCLDPVSVTSPTPLRTSPTCSVSRIGPNCTQLNPLDLIPSHPKSLSEPQLAQPHIPSGMQQLTIMWSSRDNHATMRHPCCLISRPTSWKSWDLGVPTLVLFNLFPSYCMLMLR